MAQRNGGPPARAARSASRREPSSTLEGYVRSPIVIQSAEVDERIDVDGAQVLAT